MYGNSLPGYDAWLEAPYVDAARREAYEEEIIEKLGLTEEEAADFDFDQYEEDSRNDYLEAQAEAAAELEADIPDWWDSE